MVMAVISVGILCTELTETALAVLIQTAWWFISLMTGGTSMYGGNYGWNLIPRHNTELSSAGGDTALCAGVPAGAGPGSVGWNRRNIISGQWQRSSPSEVWGPLPMRSAAISSQDT